MHHQYPSTSRKYLVELIGSQAPSHISLAINGGCYSVHFWEAQSYETSSLSKA